MLQVLYFYIQIAAGINIFFLKMNGYDIHILFGYTQSDVTQQAFTVFAQNRKMNLEPLLLLNIPFNLKDAFRFFLSFDHIFAIRAMDGNAFTPAQIADDPIARYGLAAFGKMDEDIVHPLHPDAAFTAGAFKKFNKKAVFGFGNLFLIL